jgi:hypothetical protein
MGFRLDFDRTNKLLLLSISGEVTDQFLLDAYAAVKSWFNQYGPRPVRIQARSVLSAAR